MSVKCDWVVEYHVYQLHGTSECWYVSPHQ